MASQPTTSTALLPNDTRAEGAGLPPRGHDFHAAHDDFDPTHDDWDPAGDDLPPDNEDWLSGPGFIGEDGVWRRWPPSPADAFTRLAPRAMGGGAGFDAGGTLNGVSPGPALAKFADDAMRGGTGVLSEDELVGLTLAWRRMAAWAAAGELATVLELNRRREARVAAGGDPHLLEHVSDELAAALTVTCRGADALLTFACQLGRLPKTAAALTAGEIDRARAAIIADGTSLLCGADAAAVEATVMGRAPQQTTSQLRAAVQRAVLAVDPDAAARRREKALKEARVERWDEQQRGTAALAGRDLPPAEVLAADSRISALAQRLKHARHAGTLDQLRARAFTALLLGDPDGLLRDLAGADGLLRDFVDTGTASEADGGDAECRYDALPASRGHTVSPLPPGPRGEAQASGRAVGGLRGSVNLTMPLATWLGGSDTPGDAAGFGPLAATDARVLADLIAARAGSRWCVTLTGPDGSAVAHGCVDPRRTGIEPGGWALTVTIRPMARSDCAHGRESAGYRPSPRLRHLIEIRQRTCCFPGCRRPAGHCDLDHTLAYARGGRTCECDLAPLCRRHHQAKQVQGWLVEQPQPGVMVWRLPHARTYTTTPDTYD